MIHYALTPPLAARRIAKTTEGHAPQYGFRIRRIITHTGAQQLYFVAKVTKFNKMSTKVQFKALREQHFISGIYFFMNSVHFSGNLSNVQYIQYHRTNNCAVQCVIFYSWAHSEICPWIMCDSVLHTLSSTVFSMNVIQCLLYQYLIFLVSSNIDFSRH